MSEQATRPSTPLQFPGRRFGLMPHEIAEDTSTQDLVSFAGRVTSGVLTHRELEDKLAVLGDMQPQAPLSFLAIEVHGLGKLKFSDWRRPSDIVNLIAHNVRNNTRMTDFVGRLGGSTIGVILQGSTAKQSSALASRLQSSLEHLSHTAPPITITVSAASGHGINASVLPNAALSPLGESS